MKHIAPLAALALLASPAAAQDDAEAPTPASVVAAAPDSEWKPIATKDLLVMDLAPDAQVRARRVVIQLMPAPLSEQWVENIRRLAQAHWWDGTSVYRVVDNWVTQWGDVSEEKPLPDGLNEVPESEYVHPRFHDGGTDWPGKLVDSYAPHVGFRGGFPVAWNADAIWPVHCYASVGVARDLSPNTGSGSELYVVIGHATRQLDRNIAVVGRVIDGIEYLSTLPRGGGEAGVYESRNEDTPILSVRLGDELPEAEQPHFEYLDTASPSFADYVHVRANRNDPFYRVPAGGVDICGAPVPIREADEE